MVALPFPVYDADHHLYEPAEAFLRHLPKAFQKDFYFAEVNGRTKLVIDGQLSEYIPNPTFEVVAAPGTHEIWYRAENHEGKTLRELTGKALRPPAEWRSGDGRLAVMDQQGIHAALVFPTLASIVEARLGNNPEAINALFTSFNTWLDEDWGFHREERLFAVPFVGLSDVGAAIDELEVNLKRGARAVGIRPAPVPHLRGSLSLGAANSIRSGHDAPGRTSSSACMRRIRVTTSPAGGRQGNTRSEFPPVRKGCARRHARAVGPADHRCVLLADRAWRARSPSEPARHFGREWWGLGRQPLPSL